MIVRLGDSACDPTFVGPLTQDQQTICNLQAGVAYRDALLSQDSAAAAPVQALTAGLGSGNVFLYAVLAVVFLGLVMKK